MDDPRQDEGRPPGRGQARAWAAALLPLLVTAALWQVQVAAADGLHGGRTPVLWPPLVTVGYALAAALPLRRTTDAGDRRALLFELPVLVAIFFADQAALVGGALVGTVAGRLVRGERHPRELARSAGRVAAAAQVALLVHHPVSGFSHVAGTRPLLAGLLAVAVARVAVTLLDAASVALRGDPDRPGLLAALGDSALHAATNAPIALVCVAIAYHVPHLAWLVVLPLASHALRLRQQRAEEARTLDERRRARELRARLAAAATTDTLTGLANRPGIMARMDTLLADHAVTLVVVDLDDFQRVNRDAGTEAGDQLLRTIAGRVADSVEHDAEVARLGGDEFAVLLVGQSRSDADDLADKLLRRVGERVDVADGVRVQPRATIGIAVGAPCDRGADVLARALVATRETKRRSRGRWGHWQPWMTEHEDAPIALRAELLDALAEEALEVHLQPFHELAGNRVVGAEALVRWTHPTRGPIRPDVFIPVAEEAGLIGRIGALVLARTCEQVAAWQQMGARIVASVNVSAAELLDDGLVTRIAVELGRTGADPSLLMLEITERDLLGDVARTMQRLGELKALGLRIAIDDFGTGYSSLAYLQHFPVDVIKVAREFVAAIDRPDDGGVVCRAVIDLARAMDMRVLAEAVETASQRERLRELGCDIGQGWLWSRAEPADDLCARLQRDGWHDDALGYFLVPARPRHALPRVA